VSHAIGRNTAGGYDNFIQMMNDKSKELGCTNSHWVNTYGLHDKKHYTSARDMALIGSAAFQYEEFRTITNTYQYVIGKTNLTKEKRYVHQNHKMIRDWDSRYYEYCVGGKTGYTDQALTTLITFATKGKRNFVAVTLRTHGGGNNAYADTKKILNYAFKNFRKVTIDESNIGNDKISYVEENSYVMLPEGITLEDCEKIFTEPTETGDVNGKVSYTYQGQPVGDVEVKITKEYYNEIHGIEEIVNTPEKQKEKTKKKDVFVSPILIVISCILLLIIVAFVILLCKVNYARKKAEERRREARRIYRESIDRWE
jgi:D-alanyl-D-alanine carboxypeptidase